MVLPIDLSRHNKTKYRKTPMTNEQIKAMKLARIAINSHLSMIPKNCRCASVANTPGFVCDVCGRIDTDVNITDIITVNVTTDTGRDA